MANSTNQKKSVPTYKNPLEAISDLASSTVKNTAKAIGDIGGGMFDQLLGRYNEENDDEKSKGLTSEKIINEAKKQLKKENRIFSYQEYYETTLIKREIAQLTEMIRKEIEAIKKSNASLLSEVKDVEKLAINELPEKPGIYHVRFLEIVLNLLRTLRAKVGESHTWLQTFISRKKKRGSLFAVLSKKKGTAYSLSQELQNARSVQ
ncbi:MAG: hypothetical protein KatS3mg092_0835 [Patescibacteria group bacterium]|nr:MAG: hypothetical protein KatS3mg092_0835 [Patescibacteria group bacterium]